jgi:hypothetical protein
LRDLVLFSAVLAALFAVARRFVAFATRVPTAFGTFCAAFADFLLTRLVAGMADGLPAPATTQTI